MEVVLTLPLFDYQDPAVDKFLGRGSLLVTFAMGLGKTPIGIACAEELLGDDIDLCMIVVEASLKYQWAKALAKFTDLPTRRISVKVEGEVETMVIPAESHCVMIDGTAQQRAKQYERVGATTDYIILSYNDVVNDARWVRRLDAGLVILDEATAIKTFSAARTKKVKQILKAEYRLALTGTPVDNNPMELFSIMQWVDPDVLGPWPTFDSEFIVRDDYGRPKRYRRLDKLKALMEPAMARIAHDDPRVRDYIPKASHTELYVPLSADLDPVFTAIATDLYWALKGSQGRGGFDIAAYYEGHKSTDENSELGRIMSRLLAIDLLLAHPDMVIASGQEYAKSESEKAMGKHRAVWPGSKYCYEIWQSGCLETIHTSPKLERLSYRVPEILGQDDRYKVMVYTRWPKMLRYMADAIDVKSVQVHGGLQPKARTAAVDRFIEDPDTRLFLSSYAGARGLDLYRGSHLINYDIPWAPGMADQINGRHVRASSEFKEVWVENLITDHTTDLWKFHSVLGTKRHVGRGILDGKVVEVSMEGTGLLEFLRVLLGME